MAAFDRKKETGRKKKRKDRLRSGGMDMKKLASMMLAGLLAVSMLVGCSGEAKKEQGVSLDCVTLGTYKGMEIKNQDTGKVSAEDVQAQVDSLLLSKAEQVEVDRPAKEGDTVNIDYVGSIDGVEFDGGKDEDFDLTLGSNRFIDGFEDQLIGATAGSTVDVNVTFPDGYGNGLDNKPALFVVTVHKVMEHVKPEYTDAFVAANTSYDTISEYENAVTLQLQAQLDSTEEQNRRAAVLTALVENATFGELPEEELKKYQDQLDQYYASLAEAYGVDLATLITYTGNTEEEFNQYLDETAIAMTQQHLAILAVAQAEKIEVTDEEYKTGLAEYAASYGVSEEEMLEYYTKEEIVDLILTEEVTVWLMENAVEAEKTAE